MSLIKALESKRVKHNDAGQWGEAALKAVAAGDPDALRAAIEGVPPYALDEGVGSMVMNDEDDDGGTVSTAQLTVEWTVRRCVTVG